MPHENPVASNATMIEVIYSRYVPSDMQAYTKSLVPGGRYEGDYVERKVPMLIRSTAIKEAFRQTDGSASIHLYGQGATTEYSHPDWDDFANLMRAIRITLDTV